METRQRITTLFLDIGGVLLSDGWDRNARKSAAQKFDIDHQEMEERHRINFETYELGKISLDNYLKSVVFYEKRNFNIDDFRKVMYSASKPFPEMLTLFKTLKEKYSLKIAAVSNEGRELNEYRIRKFSLDDIVDSFISSSFVHLRKPDMDIFQMAMDIVQGTASEILYIENQPIFIQNAEQIGIRSILHHNYRDTLVELIGFGLEPFSSDCGLLTEEVTLIT
ncbi:HAD family hydrolase [Pedobacter fastidiosus]|uniref:HAD hydrolase-like protein n=1 Tax=Pedobacter fastidiosus TaxID=2765361 RepID=A0ABR7KSD7_9SPHI|nr:HAD hydrolase-like protein [Pedobacter fastidiosus]MBC6110972.1 HAD hydrolase-like protein [Pedobacter fastidiosus]